MILKEEEEEVVRPTVISCLNPKQKKIKRGKGKKKKVRMRKKRRGRLIRERVIKET